MASDTTGILDEAYQRLHQTGPEFDGWLSNHGPMAAEAMVRHGRPAASPRKNAVQSVTRRGLPSASGQSAPIGPLPRGNSSSRRT